MPRPLPPAIHHSIEHNVHAIYHQTIRESLDDLVGGLGVNEAHVAECEAAGECWVLHWYPHTPIGFYFVIAPTFDLLVERAWALAEG